ncbi:MAG: hypothetical protein ACI4AD_03795 [Roseburia sp.]
MKTKSIPAIIMLTAGLVTCITGIVKHIELFEFTKTLLIVLIIFYILGSVVKVVLDRNFKEMTEEEDTTEGTEETAEDSETGEGESEKQEEK